MWKNKRQKWAITKKKCKQFWPRLFLCSTRDPEIMLIKEKPFKNSPHIILQAEFPATSIWLRLRWEEMDCSCTAAQPESPTHAVFVKCT